MSSAELTEIPTQRAFPGLALTMAAMAYVVAFGFGVLFALQYLIDGAGEVATTDRAAAVGNMLVLVFLTAVGLTIGFGSLAAVNVHHRDWFIGAPARPGDDLTVMAGVYALLLSGYLAGTYLLGTATDYTVPAAPLWVDAIDAVRAGISEELIVLALPVLVLQAILGPPSRARAVPWLIAGGVLVAMRMAYHLHYGVDALDHLPWAIGTILLYLRFHRAWPLIAAHALWNFTLALHRHDLLGPLNATHTLVGTLLALTALAVWRIRRPRS